jgi:hypothetical protein
METHLPQLRGPWTDLPTGRRSVKGRAAGSAAAY